MSVLLIKLLDMGKLRLNDPISKKSSFWTSGIKQNESAEGSITFKHSHLNDTVMD